MMLLNVLKNLDQTKFEFILFSMQNGELKNELPTSVKFNFDNNSSSLIKRVRNKLRNRFGYISSLEKQILRLNSEFKPDIWYLNTLILNDIVKIAIKYKIKYAVHFHELLSQYNYVSYSDLNKAISHSYFTVGCCNAVCENLKTLGSKRVFKQFECIDESSIIVNSERQEQIMVENNIPKDFQIIIMSGQRIDRKGFDLFIEIAQKLKNEKLFFLWLGGSKNSGFEFFMDKYIDQFQIKNLRVIHPQKSDYYNYLNCADIFFLSSREDPFPLVMLEANYLCKYIVALNSGGAVEFLDTNKGHIINSWNIDDIAEELKICCTKVKEKIIPPVFKTENYFAKPQTLLFETILQNSLSK